MKDEGEQRALERIRFLHANGLSLPKAPPRPRTFP